jgi:hypothetical protein
VSHLYSQRATNVHTDSAGTSENSGFKKVKGERLVCVKRAIFSAFKRFYAQDIYVCPSSQVQKKLRGKRTMKDLKVDVKEKILESRAF